MNVSGGNGSNSALEISIKEGFTGSNATTYSPSLSPVYLETVIVTTAPLTTAGMTPAINSNLFDIITTGFTNEESYIASSECFTYR